MQRARISYSHFRTDYVGACSTGTWSATMRLVQEDSEINNSCAAGPGMGALAKELKNLCELTTGGKKKQIADKIGDRRGPRKLN